MKVLKQNMRLVLMSLMLLLCGASFAQTQVVFEAGVDVGENSVGNHHIKKDGITFGGTRCNLAKNPYDFQTLGGVGDKKLTVSSTVGNIQKIEITGSKLNLINGQNVGSFNSSTGVWEGNSNNVELNISYTFSSSNKVTVSKVVVTLAPSVATTLSFDVDTKNPFTVYKSKESDFTAPLAKLTENKGNTEVSGAAIKYTSNNPDVVSVNETTGALSYGETGEATITASFAGVDGQYDAAQDISYTVNYKKIPTKLAFNQEVSKTYLVYKDEEDVFLENGIEAILTETLDNKQIPGIRYSSSNDEVVSVDDEGLLTFHHDKAGQKATITAYFDGDDVYEAAQEISYIIDYSLATTVLSFGEGAQQNYTVFRGQEKNFNALKATLKNDRTDYEIEGTVKYESDNADVVAVDEATGNLTFGNVGTATITASYAGEDGAYMPAKSISYTIDYKKNPLAMAYSKSLDVIYFDDKDSYAMPSLSITSNDAAVENLPVKYESSNTEAATVSNDGAITIVGNGEATITASVADNYLYDDATATYTVRVADPENIFYESFDNVEGKGGNDGTWEAGDGDTFNSELCDNAGWYEKSSTGGTYQTVLQADKCLNIYGQASLISGDLKYLNGAALLTFKAGAAVKSNPATPSVKITVVDGNKNIVEQSVEVPVGEFKEYSIVIPNGTPNTHLEFWGEHASNRFLVTVEYNIFIDSVKVTRLAPIYESADNTAVINANAGKENVNIMLDRKLSNEYWNTVCFPFDLEQEQVNELFGENTQIREFDRVEGTEMVFVEPTEKDGITAGVPYLFKPENNITSPLFFRAEISNVTIPSVKVDANGNEYKFIGVTSPVELLPTDIFIGTDANLYYPDETEGANKLNGMRAYIQLPAGMDAKSFTMNTDGTTTAINNAAATAKANGMVYTISGQLVGNVSLNTLPKGVYMVNGKKFIVK